MSSLQVVWKILLTLLLDEEAVVFLLLELEVEEVFLLLELEVEVVFLLLLLLLAMAALVRVGSLTELVVTFFELVEEVFFELVDDDFLVEEEEVVF